MPGDDKGFANSGVQYRSRIFDPANWVVGGYQADMEAGPTYTGILYEERLRGILSRLYGRTIGLQVTVDPDVLGGLVIRVGDEVIDGSIAHRLAEAERRLAG